MKNTNTSEILTSLESLYQKKKFREAKQLLLNNKSLFDSGHFSYNMGTLYAKSGEPAAARYHLEKAKISGFIDSRLSNNLDVVKESLSVKDISNSPSFYDRSVDQAMGASEGIFLMISLVLVLFTITCVKFRWLKNIKIVTVLLCLSIFPYVCKKYYLDKITFAINLKEVIVREGPSAIYEEIGRMKPGTKFIVGDNHNGWLYIKHPLSQVGWVYRDKVALY